MKQVYLLLIFCLMSVVGWGQTTIDFDNNSNWTSGSGTINSYQTDHVFSESNMVFTGGDALRQTASNQDGVAGALGTYSWRLRDNSSVSWTATYSAALNANESFSAFGFDVRRWDSSPSSDFLVEYSTDGGTGWTTASNIGTSGVIDNTALGNSSNWSTFSQTISTVQGLAANQFIVRISAQGTTERIMIDNFSYTVSVALPITLSSFVADKQNNTTHLHWRTSTEVNNDYMAIERSSDGRTFEEIGRVQGRGTTQIEQSYSFVDEWPLPGINYYRLRQVDFDGRYEYHETVAVDFSDKTTGKLLVYPTQVDSHLKIVADSEMNKDAQVQVLSTDGKIWKTTHWLEKSTLMELSVDKLPAGSYWLRVLDGERVDQAYFQKI
ncbi:MAG: hypothetical protein MI974_05215 [Chitinophagales bacterium]|nr:hypothetical protein [Chitinophagales bacterium]